MITALQQKRFLHQVKRQRRFKSVVLKNNLNEQEVARISVQLHRLQGLSIKANKGIESVKPTFVPKG